MTFLFMWFVILIQVSVSMAQSPPVSSSNATSREARVTKASEPSLPTVAEQARFWRALALLRQAEGEAAVAQERAETARERARALAETARTRAKDFTSLVAELQKMHEAQGYEPVETPEGGISWKKSDSKPDPKPVVEDKK